MGSVHEHPPYRHTNPPAKGSLMTHPTPEAPETDVTEVTTNPETTKPKKAWFQRPAFIVPVCALVIAAGVGVPVAANAAAQAQRIEQYNASVDAANTAFAATAAAEAAFPQALALYLAEYQARTGTHLEQLKLAADAPAELIPDKLRAAIAKLHTEQGEALVQLALREEQQKEAEAVQAEVAAVEAESEGKEGPEPTRPVLVTPVAAEDVDQTVLEAQLEVQEKAERDLGRAQGPVEELVASLSELDGFITDAEDALTAAGDAAVKNADAYLAAFSKAGDAGTAAATAKQKLADALTDLADMKSTNLEAEADPAYDFEHEHTDQLRETATVRAALAEFLTSAAAAKAAHQAAVDAEAAAAAAAANAETYVDSSGQTVTNPNYVGYTSSGTWSGGGAASSGGTNGAPAPAPGGGGGGYVQAPIPSTPPTVANNGNYMPGCVNGGVVQSVNSPGGVVGAPSLPYDYYISGTTVYFLGCVY